MCQILDERENAMEELFELRGGNNMDAGDHDALWGEIRGMKPGEVLAALESEGA